MNLRPYQVDLLNQVRQAYRDGFSAPCIVAPCGAGKSIITAEIARGATAKGNRVLFIVHRYELCDQIAKMFYRYGVDMTRCAVGMVQTVSRRLGRMAPPGIIITDENHHAPANTYRKIYNYFPEAKRVGVTATPIRLNGGGLGDVNDKLIIGASTQWLIDNNYLSPFDYYAPAVADLTGLRIKNGEYVAADVEISMDKSAIYGDVINYYKRYSDSQQAICYCASIKHSKHMAESFSEAGIPAQHIDGDTDKKERTKAIARFRNGDTKILCNVDLISEGFDVPDCTTSILLRPTQSLALYIQQSMRCMRYKPGKQAIILDHVGNYARFGLPNAARTWSLAPKPVSKSEDPSKLVRQCPVCYYTHNVTPECPKCGFIYPIKSRKIGEVKDAELQNITGFKLDYTQPENCHTMRELYALAAKRGYKKGWAYYKGLELGLV